MQVVDKISRTDVASPPRAMTNAAQSRIFRVPELLRPLSPASRTFGFAPTIDGRLRIVKPFTVELEEIEEGGFVARIDEIDEFGIGPSSGDALHDLGKTLAELYFSLREQSPRLSPDLQSVLKALSQHIEFRHL
jgi:hypothetical protein